jgi:hypothetical protein
MILFYSVEDGLIGESSVKSFDVPSPGKLLVGLCFHNEHSVRSIPFCEYNGVLKDDVELGVTWVYFYTPQVTISRV